MAKIPPTPIPPHSTPLPDPSDPNTYGPRGRAMWAHEVEVMVPGMNTLADQTLQNAEHAEDMANIAESVSFLQGEWSGLTGPLNMPAVVTHNDDYWVLLSNLADVTTSEPGVSGDWALYERPHASQVEVDAAALGFAALTVQEALQALAASENLVDNPSFNRLRRGEGTVGYDTSLTAGQFVVDRWKGGSAGATLGGLGTSPLGATVDISAGSLAQQIRRSFGVYAPEDLVLAWEGTAEGRFNGGTYGTSPLVLTGVSAVFNPEIEFRDGTLKAPRLFIGTRDRGPGPDVPSEMDEYIKAGRYYQELNCTRRWFASAGEVDATMFSFPPMVALPTAAVLSTATNTNVTSATFVPTGRNQLQMTVTATAAALTARVSQISLDTGY